GGRKGPRVRSVRVVGTTVLRFLGGHRTAVRGLSTATAAGARGPVLLALALVLVLVLHPGEAPGIGGGVHAREVTAVEGVGLVGNLGEETAPGALFAPGTAARTASGGALLEILGAGVCGLGLLPASATWPGLGFLRGIVFGGGTVPRGGSVRGSVGMAVLCGRRFTTEPGQRRQGVLGGSLVLRGPSTSTCRASTSKSICSTAAARGF